MFTGVFKAGPTRQQLRGRSLEQALRAVLQSRRLRRHRFNLRQLIGPFIVDAVCPERALVIQVEREHQAFRDRENRERVVLLERMGYRVVTLWSRDLLERPQRVIETILDSLD